MQLLMFVIPVNVNEEEDEITNEVYELKRWRKEDQIGSRIQPFFPTPNRSTKTHTNLVSSDIEKLQELTVTDTQTTTSSRSPNTKLSKTYRLLSLFKAKPAWDFCSDEFNSIPADHLPEVMVESLPTIVDMHIKEQVKKQVPEQVRDQVPVYVAEGLIMERQKTKEEMERMIMKFKNLQVPQTTCRPSVVRKNPRESGRSLMMNALLEGENSAHNQEQVDDYDFWTDSYASNDDEIPIKQVPQDIIEEYQLTND
ncbi:hypothetical protein Tco_0917913 [Tanacetum coccineum]